MPGIKPAGFKKWTDSQYELLDRALDRFVLLEKHAQTKRVQSSRRMREELRAKERRDLYLQECGRHVD